jgi:hypothetical protein
VPAVRPPRAQGAPDPDRGSLVALVVRSVGLLVGVAALPVSLIVILWWIGTSGSRTTGGIELTSPPPGGWNALLWVFGWLFVLLVVVCVIGVAAFFLIEGGKVLRSRPPLTDGLRQLIGVYVNTVKEFSEHY